MTFSAYLTRIRKRLDQKSTARDALRSFSDEARKKSKRSIFAYHREDGDSAKRLLKEAQIALESARRAFKTWPSLESEGMYREAAEEYLEARLFEGFLGNGKALVPEETWLDDETYLAGLSDAVGEVARFALARATVRDEASVERASLFAQEALGALIDMDLTGYLRNKVDQAKQHVRRIEEIRYDLSLRRPE